MPRSRSAPAALVAVALLAAGPLHAASDTNLRPDAPAQKKDEIRVPIPGWSPEVSSNGCHVRRSPDETTPDRKAGRLEVPFWGLVERATGRHAAKAGYAAPDVFARQIAPLDEDLRRLVLLAVLRNRFGRDGQHTFFFLDGGSVAPAIRQALEEAGLTRA